MIHVVTDENRAVYEDYLEELWQQRYQVFVEKMGWDLECPNGHERDQFDTDLTTYLLSIDNYGRLKGAMRLLPTTQDHLLNCGYEHLCADGVPTGPEIWEVSRIYSLTGRHMLLERDKTVSELMCGMYEHALLSGIKKVSCVASMVLFPTILKAGWDVTPLGLPDVANGGEVVLAFLIDLSAESYPKVRAERGIEGSVLSTSTSFKEEQLAIAG